MKTKQSVCRFMTVEVPVGSEVVYSAEKKIFEALPVIRVPVPVNAITEEHRPTWSAFGDAFKASSAAAAAFHALMGEKPADPHTVVGSFKWSVDPAAGQDGTVGRTGGPGWESSASGPGPAVNRDQVGDACQAGKAAGKEEAAKENCQDRTKPKEATVSGDLVIPVAEPKPEGQPLWGQAHPGDPWQDHTKLDTEDCRIATESEMIHGPGDTVVKSVPSWVDERELKASKDRLRDVTIDLERERERSRAVGIQRDTFHRDTLVLEKDLAAERERVLSLLAQLRTKDEALNLERDKVGVLADKLQAEETKLADNLSALDKMKEELEAQKAIKLGLEDKLMSLHETLSNLGQTAVGYWMGIARKRLLKIKELEHEIGKRSGLETQMCRYTVTLGGMKVLAPPLDLVEGEVVTVYFMDQKARPSAVLPKSYLSAGW